MNIQLQSWQKKEAGTSVSRRTRRAGRVPCVIYNKNKSVNGNRMVIVDFNKITNLLLEEDNFSKNIELSIDDSKEKLLVKIKDIQRHPVNSNIMHIDFYLQ